MVAVRSLAGVRSPCRSRGAECWAGWNVNVSGWSGEHERPPEAAEISAEVQGAAVTAPPVPCDRRSPRTPIPLAAIAEHLHGVRIGKRPFQVPVQPSVAARG